MRSKLLRFFFILLAPISLPLYVLFLAAANLIGAAFYVVIDASAARVMRRPITLSFATMVLLTVPVVCLAPVAALAHFAVFVVMGVGRGLCSLGRWQCNSENRNVQFGAGFAWILIAAWISITCLNAGMGSILIGKPVRGADLYAESYLRSRVLKELPDYCQNNRRKMIDELDRRHAAIHPEWETLKKAMEDDECLFRWLPTPVRMKLVGMPWYYVPAALSDDGLAHSELLLGPLLFAWLLLIRWPGPFSYFSLAVTGMGFLILRLLFAAGSIVVLLTWTPATDYFSFSFGSGGSGLVPIWFSVLSPARWLGVEYGTWVRPEWWIFNGAIWLILVGIVMSLWSLAWRIAPLVGTPKYYVAFLASRLLQRKRIAFFSVGAVTLCVAMMIIVISVMGGFTDVIRARAHGLLGDLVMDAGLQGFPYYQEFIDEVAKLKDAKSGQPLIVQATPLIHTYGILQFPKTKKTASVKIWGIRLEEYVRVNEFGKDLFYQNRFGGTTLGAQQQPVYAVDANGLPQLPGDMDAHYREFVRSLPPKERAEEEKKFKRLPGDLFPGPGVFKGPENAAGFEGKKYPGIIIGRSILFRRQASGEFNRHDDYPRGEVCLLTVLPVTRSGDISPEPPPKPAFRYTDDSRTGIHEIDSVNVYVDFEQLQSLLSMGREKKTDGGVAGARCSQVLIRLNPEISSSREKTFQAKQLIDAKWRAYRDLAPADSLEYAMLRQVDVSTWEEMQASYIAAIEKEKFLVLIMFGVISIVAVFLILCIFYMIVQEKTRDIGIIKSIGGSPAGVAAVFLAYGAAIGLVGCILGSLLGTYFVEHINDVQDGLARINPNWRVWSPETYSFDKIPDVWKGSEVIGICILAIISSILGALFPAIRAGKTWPVESLRYE